MWLRYGCGCSNWPHPQIVFWAQEHNFWWPWKWFRFTLPRPAGLHRPEALFEFGKSKSDGIGLILLPIAGCSRSNTLCIGRNYPSDGKVCQVDRWRQLLGAMILLNLMFSVFVIRACLKCIICIDLLHVWMPVNASLHLFARAAQAWHLPTLATSCTCRRCSLHALVSCIRYLQLGNEAAILRTSLTCWNSNWNLTLNADFHSVPCQTHQLLIARLQACTDHLEEAESFHQVQKSLTAGAVRLGWHCMYWNCFCRFCMQVLTGR